MYGLRSSRSLSRVVSSLLDWMLNLFTLVLNVDLRIRLRVISVSCIGDLISGQVRHDTTVMGNVARVPGKGGVVVWDRNGPSEEEGLLEREESKSHCNQAILQLEAAMKVRVPQIRSVSGKRKLQSNESRNTLQNRFLTLLYPRQRGKASVASTLGKRSRTITVDQLCIGWIGMKPKNYVIDSWV